MEWDGGIGWDGRIWLACPLPVPQRNAVTSIICAAGVFWKVVLDPSTFENMILGVVKLRTALIFLK